MNGSSSKNQHWNSLPSLPSVAIPQAKVYLRDSNNDLSPRESGVIRPNSPTRYNIAVEIVKTADSEKPHSGIRSNLFVVKGNPLVTTSSPLPCFASGAGTVTIDIRDGEDLSVLCLQVLIQDMGAHFGLPLDELLDLSDSQGGVERSITIWDAQSGSMRGSCDVIIKVEKEQPLSVTELVDLRRKRISLEGEGSPSLRHDSGSPSLRHDSVRNPVDIPLDVSIASERALEFETQSDKTQEPQEDIFAKIGQRANDLLAAARNYTEPLEEKKDERLVASGLSSPSQNRGRRRGGGANFAINSDAASTVIPE